MPLLDRVRNALNVMVEHMLKLAQDEDQASCEHALIANCKAAMVQVVRRVFGFGERHGPLALKSLLTKQCYDYSESRPGFSRA